MCVSLYGRINAKEIPEKSQRTRVSDNIFKWIITLMRRIELKQQTNI